VEISFVSLHLFAEITICRQLLHKKPKAEPHATREYAYHRRPHQKSRNYYHPHSRKLDSSAGTGHGSSKRRGRRPKASTWRPWYFPSLRALNIKTNHSQATGESSSLSGKRNLGAVVIEDVASERRHHWPCCSMWIDDLLVVQRASFSGPGIMASGTRMCWNSVGELPRLELSLRGTYFYSRECCIP
jgi:hypothetical protein